MKKVKRIAALMCAILTILTIPNLATVAQANAPAVSVPAYTDVAQFPESYRNALITMKNMFPGWRFEPMNVNIDWNDVVTAQYSGGQGDRSLVWHTLDSRMRDNNRLHSPNWYYASREGIAYYLDPRNWLTERNIFQFEKLTYDKDDHTVTAVERFLTTSGSFMSSTKTPKVPGDTRTYAQLFVDVGKQYNVSPFHLASRVHMEQGSAGTSPLISGTYKCTSTCTLCPAGGPYADFTGFYNYYNIAAAGNTNAIVYHSGLQRAKTEGWNTPAKAIAGGADFLSKNYIAVGQDTLYLQKFDLVGTLYTHQYMQSISAPSGEAVSMRNMYENSGSLDSTFVFKIPVYKNMPAAPVSSGFNNFSITLTPPSGYSNRTVYLDGVPFTASQSGSNFTVTAPGIYSTTAIMYKYNSAGTPTGMSVWTLAYGNESNGNGKYTTITRRDALVDLLSYHGFSIRITGNTGIRVKTGISADSRAYLLGSNLGGFTLSEYGTLVMDNSKMNLNYPLIKGGQGVGQGVSYGKDSSGKNVDVVFEHVEGRYRFTSVLVNLPPANYKTDFAFRGYIILNNGQRRYILYGPPAARSIYTVAQQYLDLGTYPEGSDADIFLRKLIADAPP